MLQVTNNTKLSGKIFVVPDPKGIDSLYTVVKATFVIAQKVTLAEKQSPITMEDEYEGEPGKSSLRKASDICLAKPATDILLNGTAHAPNGKATPQMDVSLTVGPVSKTIRVIGDRVWKSGFLGDKPSSPQPFTTMALSWERAYGGTDLTKSDPPEVKCDGRNPVGAGFHTKEGRTKLEGLKLPNLEDPAQLISSAKHQPPPTAFAALCPHWEPRRKYAGTYDEAWQKNRAPYLPTDFDPRFFQLASADQLADGYLAGGEPVMIEGASPNGTLRFNLPRFDVQVTHRMADDDIVRDAVLDTVLIEPDDARLTLVWRSVLPCDKKSLRVEEVQIAASALN